MLPFSHSPAPAMKRTLGPLSPTLVLTLTLLATAAAGWGAWTAMRQRVQTRFDQEASELGGNIRGRIDTTVTAMRGAAAFVAITGANDGKTFERYVEALELGRDRAGLEGVGLSKERPCDGDEPTIAPEVGGEIAVEVPIVTTRGGRAHCAGVVFARLRTAVLVRAAVDEEHLPAGVGARVVDESHNVLFESPAPPSVEYAARRPIPLPGRLWTLELAAPRSYANVVERWFPAGVLAIGIAVALVVFVVMRAQGRALRRERESREVLALVDDAGRALALELDPRRLPELVAQLVAARTGAEVAAVVVAGELVAWHAPGNGESAALVRDMLDDGSSVRWRSRATARVGRSDRGDLVLTIGCERPGGFRDRERRILDGLATHAAIALDNAQLLARTRALVAELERGNRALSRSNRELDEFAYATSHDLRAPLHSLGNLVDWLEEDLGDRADEEVHAHLARMRGRIHRLETMIDAVLRFARAGRDLTTVDVDPAQILDQVMKELGPEAATHVAVGPLPPMRGDPRALRDVLHHLIENSLRHSGRDDVHVQVRAVERDDAWELIVADDGRGVPEPLHQRIWNMFETVEPRDRVDGSGLGLALVRKLAEASGGRSWVESGPGLGAAFHVTWPRDPARSGG
jgi:signal transduction histidine kinase